MIVIGASPGFDFRTTAPAAMAAAPASTGAFARNAAPVDTVANPAASMLASNVRVGDLVFIGVAVASALVHLVFDGQASVDPPGGVADQPSCGRSRPGQ